MLHRATQRSVVVIDEFGKGTLTSDGVGLLSSMLSHFAGLAPRPSRLLACTHFHELARPEVMAPSPQIAFHEMRVLIEGGDDEVGGGSGGGSDRPRQHGPQGRASGAAAGQQEPVFLYKLAPGHSAPSFGLHCARMCGVPDALLRRAAAVVAAARRGAPVARLALPPLRERDERSRALARRLAAADLSNPAAVAALLAAAAAAEAGPTAAARQMEESGEDA
jgi:DNA mismatch repair protein MSH5